MVTGILGVVKKEGHWDGKICSRNVFLGIPDFWNIQMMCFVVCICKVISILVKLIFANMLFAIWRSRYGKDTLLFKACRFYPSVLVVVRRFGYKLLVKPCIRRAKKKRHLLLQMPLLALEKGGIRGTILKRYFQKLCC